MKLRKLTDADGVEYSLAIEPEDIDPADQFDDLETVADIQDRLARGDETAWCCIRVTAEWRGHSASALLGGCSLGPDYSGWDAAKEHGMHAAALEALNAQLASVVADLAPLMEES